MICCWLSSAVGQVVSIGVVWWVRVVSAAVLSRHGVWCSFPKLSMNCEGHLTQMFGWMETRVILCSGACVKGISEVPWVHKSRR